MLLLFVHLYYYVEPQLSEPRLLYLASYSHAHEMCAVFQLIHTCKMYYCQFRAREISTACTQVVCMHYNTWLCNTNVYFMHVYDNNYTLLHIFV